MLNKIEDLSGLKRAIVHYFASRVRGSHAVGHRDEITRFVSRFVGLVDKAIYEYGMARQAILHEAKERNETYEEIIKRGGIQYLFAPAISNHFENCIITLGILFKLLDKIDEIFFKDILNQIEKEVSVKTSDKEKVEKIEIQLESMKEFKKSIETMKQGIKKKDFLSARNSLEHIDERILRGKPGPVMPRIKADGSGVELLDHEFTFEDLVLAIKNLHSFIISLL